MKMRINTQFLVGLLGLLTADALAQSPVPPALRLPAGARVRVFAAGHGGIEAYLSRHDDASVTLAFPGEGPLAPPTEMEVPAASIERMEMSLGKKRHGWLGAAIGAVVVGLTGFSDPIDTSGNCDYQSSAPCSRAEAVVIAALAGAAMGGVVGHFVQTEQWTPVALDALAPLPPSASEIRSAPGGATVSDRGPAPLRLSFRF
jgi:hypothetical protein